ncbi:uncharacterized protein LOC113367343 [Ctenocephalides felis]|uniref:uncharacterized protein LOC113367343 n=1 Tax=Ctenocephalides felis TaxID=7515 RepID=UPI000E6E3F50|nr:uncharacterized protein LOC113367343 [Ctenocephalides felis]
MPQGNANCKCPSTAPDLGNGQPHQHMQYAPQPGMLLQTGAHVPLANRTSTASESRKQFLSSLAPLTACVSANHHAMGNHDDYYYQLSRPGERVSVASSGTQCSEYSLGDIDEVLMKTIAPAPPAVGVQQQDGEQVAPDVIAGTPGTPGSQELPIQDELAAFVQQDASRIERIKKRYGAAESINTNNASGSDDEHDDYGFNRRPSVRGIKPRFGSTTEILQQMQTQLQSPPSTLTKNQHIHPPAQHQPMPIQKQLPNQPLPQPAAANVAAAAAQQQAQWYYHFQDRDGNHRHSYHQEENMYQNIYDRHPHYGMHHQHPHQHHPNYTAARSPSRGRPESPPPLRNYHQTMVLIPYNNQEAGYVHQPHYSTNEVHATEMRMHDRTQDRYRRSYPMMEYHHHQQQSLIHVGQQMIRLPMPNNANVLPPGNAPTGYASPSQVQLHLVTGPGPRPAYPMRYSGPQRQYSDSPPGRNQQPQYANTAEQQQQQYGDQPHEASKYSTLTKYPERGVPEGAAAITVPPQQDGYTITSPTGGSQTNIAPATDSSAPVFYAMNV